MEKDVKEHSKYVTNMESSNGKKKNKDVIANLEPLGMAERRQGRKAFLPVQNVRRIADRLCFYCRGG